LEPGLGQCPPGASLERPIFDAVRNFEYAEHIARDRNTTDALNGNAGFVVEIRGPV
jgi:hypothetical protein